MEKVVVRKYTLKDFEGVLKVALELPEWFTKDGISSMTKDLKYQSGFIAEENNLIIGFLSFFVNQGKAEIGWMGVRKKHHKKGVGKALIAKLKKELSASDIKELFVHTLGPSVDYEPYKKTRLFYEKIGFVKEKSIFHENNPEYEEELIMKLVL